MSNPGPSILTRNNNEGVLYDPANGNVFAGGTILFNTTNVGGGGVALSASNSSQNTGTVSFSNANGVSFGLSNGVLTATITPGAAAGIAALQVSNTTYTSGTAIFSNANGVSFGSSAGGAITASYSQLGQAFSASGGSSSFQTLGFSNANGVTFSNSAGQVVASYNSTSGAGTGATIQGTNISASATLNANGLSLQLSGGAGGGGGVAISAAGSSVNAGTVVLSNSNGVSFGMNGSTITAQVAAAAQSATIAALGNTTAQSSSNTVALSAFNVSGSGVVSVGMSGNTLIISAPGTTNFANLSVSAGTTSGSLGSLVFSNGNGVSFGLNGSTITASAAGGGGGGINGGVSNLGNTAGSTGTVSTGNVVFVGTGPISLSQSTGAAGSAATISINGPAVSSIIGNNGLSVSTTGSTISLIPQTSSLVGVGQISISSNGSTISVIGNPQLSFFNANPYGVTNTSQIGQGSIHISPLYDAEPFSASRADIFVSNTMSSSSNSSHAGAVSLYMGLYSRNGSTLSLASSGSQSYQWTNTSNNSLGSLTGVRALSVPLNVNYTGGDLWVGIMSQTASTNANWFTMSNCMAALPLGTQLQGLLGQATNNTNQYNLGMGVFSTTSAAMPASMAFSAITGQGSAGAGAALSVAPIRFANFTA